MQIEAKLGKKYKDRNGDVHEIAYLHQEPAGGYIVSCDKHWHYLENGQLFQDHETEYDLVEEVK